MKRRMPPRRNGTDGCTSDANIGYNVLLCFIELYLAFSHTSCKIFSIKRHMYIHSGHNMISVNVTIATMM